MTDLACECTHVDPLGGPVAPGEYPEGTFGGGPSTPSGPAPAPTIYNILPFFGPADTSTLVTITQGNVVGGAGLMVLADGVDHTPGTFNGSVVAARLTLPAGRHAISVRNPDGQVSNAKNWDAGPPVLDSLNPNTISLAAGPVEVICRGKGFTAGVYLYIGSHWFSGSAGQYGNVAAYVDPAVLGVGTFDAYLSMSGLTSNTLPFTVTA
jgi:hypothetical protein